MKVTVEFDAAQERQLAETAKRLDVPIEELAAAAVRDMLAQSEADFQSAAERVLKKNRELYQRLS